MSVFSRGASYLRRWLLKALLFMAAVPPAAGVCPKPCACNVPTEVHCTFRYLTAVPDSIQPAVQRMNLGWNSLTTLRETDLPGLEKLEILMVHSNMIHTIEDRTFQDLRSLKVLKMSFNRVKKIQKDTFKGLGSLLRLHMDHNLIEFINPEAFYGLTNLQLVHLEGNHLQQLHPDTFITLRHNQVFKVSSVTNIHLSNNLLTTLPENIFSGCSHLESLFLHGNPWTCDCHMRWFSVWTERNTGVLKCKQDRRYPSGLICPVCRNPVTFHNRSLSRLSRDAFTCSKPWIQPHLKQKNISVDEGDFTPVSPKDFIAPLGTLQMNLTNQFHNDASLSCSVQRPSAFENLTQILEEEGGEKGTLLTADITTYLVCNIDYEHIQQVWQILAIYSDSPMRLERGLMVARSPEMIYRYSQIKTKEVEDEIHTYTEAEIKASPAWLMQGEVSFQLDRAATTFSTLHIKYQSVVSLRVESKLPSWDRYSWTMIKRHNQTKTEHIVITGGVVQLNCEIQGEPKPLLEWILPDGTKVRAPFSSEDSKIIISAEGKLTVQGADFSDTGVYRCIATNYLDADILIFRVTVISPNVEEADVNGIQLSRPLGENLVLDCSSSGSPEASVHWILPDQSVLHKSHGNRKMYENGTLLIQSLTARDRGFYRCLVANLLGVDLLVSQLTLSVKKSETVAILDSEGSGIGDKIDPSLNENTVALNDISTSSPTDRTIEESRTIPVDLSYSRFRSNGRGGADRKWGQKRRGQFINRNRGSSRVFDKTSRKVDPQKLATFMKKAKYGSQLKPSAKNGQIQLSVPHTGLYGENEIGSGEDFNEEHLIVTPLIVKPTTDYPQKSMLYGQGNSKQNAIITKQNDKPKFTKSPTGGDGSQNGTIRPYDVISHEIDISNFDETSEFYALEGTIKPNSSQETQLQFSGEQPSELETSTWASSSLTTDTNVAPMSNSSGPVDLIINTSTDSESQMIFTPVITTERQQDGITFHTNQTIKSPHMPAGSTIISKQHIQVIPHKSRGKGRRRTFQGRRRIIKTSRITDIQSFFNKLKQPSIKTKENAPVPNNSELTTDCDCDEDKGKPSTIDVQVLKPTASFRAISIQRSTASPTSYYTTSVDPLQSRSEVSSGYITSNEFDPTIYPFSNTQKAQFILNRTLTTTTASKVIRGKIPWNRLFGSNEKEKILGRLKRPFISRKISPKTTAETKTAAPTSFPTTMLTTTTSNSFSETENLSPFRLTNNYSKNKKGSSDEDNEGLSSSDMDFTTFGPIVHHLTSTSSAYYSRPYTTAETTPVKQTLPFPPTIKSPLAENTDDPILSGSGRLPDNRFIIRRRPGWTRGGHGLRRRPFRGRRPFNRPAIIELYPKRKTIVSSRKVTTLETTTLPQQIISTLPFYASSRKESTMPLAESIDQTSKEEKNLLEKLYWSTSNYLPVNTATKTPFSSSITLSPTTPLLQTTTKGPYFTVRTEVGSINKIRPPTWSNNVHRPPIRRTRPTPQSSEDKGSIFDTMTIFTVQEEYVNTVTPYSEIERNIAYSSVYDHVPGNGATSSSIADLEPTTTIMPGKPKMIGGNAASFNVLSHSDAFLPCKAIGNPQPTISWKRLLSTGNIITINGKRGRFEVSSNGTLSIHKANIKDHGQYLCLAENDHGSDKLLVTLSVVSYPSRILEPKVREVKSLSGNSVKMECKAEGRPMPTISWILANQTWVRGLNTKKGRVSLTAEGTLVIDHVSVYDRGHYNCIASNLAGSDTATIRLQVVAAPPGIKEEKLQQVKRGVSHDLWLPCTAQGSPQPIIHWVLNDGSVLQSNRPFSKIRTLVYENGTLHITNLTQTDGGKYECIATSSTASERRVVIVTVETQESAPQIVEMSESMTELSFGDQLRLNCSATGDPKPRIMWRLPSGAVVDQWHRMGSRIQVLDNGTLIVSTVTDKDAGAYHCVAQSKIGDDLQLMKVTVSMEPAKINPKLYEKKTVAYGNDLNMDCKATGSPKPEISWGLPDGTLVSNVLQSDDSNGGGQAQRYTLFDNGTLYLNQVGTSEEGDYTCFAENQVGKDEMIIRISVVTSAPKIHPSNQNYARVKPGVSIRFDCEAVGEPKPKILWILPSNDVIASSNEHYLMHANGSLDIKDVKIVDAGEYVCMARNPAGENKRVYKLDIYGNPPLINGYQQSKTVIKDVVAKFSRKLIDCKAEGNPTPSVTWIMPDNIFLKAPYFGSRINVHHNGTLEIRNVRPTDTAEFICVASNEGGEAVMVVQLEVTSRLRRPMFKNPFNERIMSQIGKTVVLNCSADGHPLPESIWTLPSGTRFTGETNHGSQHRVGNDGSLVIYSPRKEDAGKYRCGAKNSMGYIEKIIILEFGKKPYILTRPRGIIRSVSGDPLFLHCVSDGSPKPKIYWTIPGGHTYSRPRVGGRYQVLDNGTLVIQDTTPRDRGNYICRARNDAGEAVLTVPVVIIAYPPRITRGPPPNIKALKGTPIHLTCAATGIPKPEIIWQLPDNSVLSAAEIGQPIDSVLLHPQGTLTIQRPSTSDTGTYKCVAKNQLGTDSKVTYVHVL